MVNESIGDKVKKKTNGLQSACVWDHVLVQLCDLRSKTPPAGILIN